MLHITKIHRSCAQKQTYTANKNKTIYNNLDNNVANFFSITGNAIAEINRDLPKIQENNIFMIDISDITQDEKNAGLNALLNVFNQEQLTAYESNIKSDDLESRKYIKLARLRSIKDSKLSEFSYNDKIYQIDESSKTNINGKISAILLSQNTEAPIQSVNWIAKDNTITQFSTAEFLAFSQAIANYIEMILFKNDQLRTAINKAKSLEALNKINLNFGG